MVGRPTFPAIFAVVCTALALNIAFPGISLTILIAGILPGMLMMLFKAPFMTILLTAFMLNASEHLIALIVFSVGTVLIIAPYIERAMAQREAAA